MPGGGHGVHVGLGRGGLGVMRGALVPLLLGLLHHVRLAAALVAGMVHQTRGAGPQVLDLGRAHRVSPGNGRLDLGDSLPDKGLCLWELAVLAKRSGIGHGLSRENAVPLPIKGEVGSHSSGCGFGAMQGEGEVGNRHALRAGGRNSVILARNREDRVGLGGLRDDGDIHLENQVAELIRVNVMDGESGGPAVRSNDHGKAGMPLPEEIGSAHG